MKKILFNDKYCLTSAVLAGTKTMTRRVLRNNVPLGNWEETAKHLPYKVGEVVAIAQRYKDLYSRDDVRVKFNPFFDMTEVPGWKNKLFVESQYMPHHVKITDVKIERLRDISEEDALREGIFKLVDKYFLPNGIDEMFASAHNAFAYLINKVSGKSMWESNPWVVAYSFELVD